ncbi:wax ester synthase/diacylglycerol acyltransferase 4-like isoform X2 [Wolffia australiana]
MKKMATPRLTSTNTWFRCHRWRRFVGIRRFGRFTYCLSDTVLLCYACITVLAIVFRSWRFFFLVVMPRLWTTLYLTSEVRKKETLKGVLYTLPYAIAVLRHPHRKREELFLTVGGELKSAPRKMASLTLRLDDLKAVKNKLEATINDVFVGLVSCGISKYVGQQLVDGGTENPTICATMVVNIRGHGSKEVLRSIREKGKIPWGNKFGFFLLPIRLENTDDPLKFNVASLVYKFSQNSSMLLSNIVGPSGPIKLDTNLITNIGVTLSCLPGAIDVHLISYNGKAFLQFLVAEDVIPEPELLCRYVEEALTEMIADILNVDDVAD